MRSLTSAVAFVCLLALTVVPAAASESAPAGPPPPPFQALLLDLGGLPAQGSHDVRLRFMSASLGGELIYEVVRTGTDAVHVDNGVLRVPLTAPGTGLPETLRSALRDDQPVYVGVIVDGDLLEPRIRVVASSVASPLPSVLLPPSGLSRGRAQEAILWAGSDRLQLYGATGTPGEATVELPLVGPHGTVCDPGGDLPDGVEHCDQWLSPAGELPDAPALRNSWRNYMDHGPLGFPPPGAVERAWQRRLELDAAASRVPESTSVSFTGDTWVNLGPAPIVDQDDGMLFGGRLRSVAVHPTQPDTIYVGAASGGLWKTTNGGDSWIPLSDFEKSLAIGCIALDPEDPDIIYAGTGELGGPVGGAGLLKSVDAGASWSLKGEALFGTLDDLPKISGIALDPRPVASPASDRVVLIAGTKGLWRSPDGGDSWQMIDYHMFTDVVIDPTAPQIVYAAQPGMGVWRSLQSGVPGSWIRLPNFIDGLSAMHFGRMHMQIVVDPISSDPVLYVSAEDKYAVGALKGIWKSADDGVSWTRVAGHPVAFSLGGGVSSPLGEVEPNNTFFEAHLVGIGDVIEGAISSASDRDYFAVDVDGNMLNIEITSHRMGQGLDSELYLYDSSLQRVVNVAGVPLGGDRNFKGTADERLGMSGWTSLTPGRHFIEVRPHDGTTGNYQLSITGIDLGCNCGYDQVLAVDPSNPDNMYAGFVWLPRSTDGGVNWTDIHEHGPGNRVHADIQGMAFHPTNPNIMFWATDGGLFKTYDRGDHWESLNSNLSTTQIEIGMTQHPGTENLILVGMQDNGSAVYRGSDWKLLRGGDGTFTGVGDFDTWYAADLRLNTLRWDNFGQTDTDVSPPGWVFSHRYAPFLVHPDPAHSETLIAGTTRNAPDNTEYVVARTTNAGANWTLDDDNLGAPISALAYAPDDTNTQYAGTTVGTVWRTLDNGANWHEIDWTGRPLRGVNDLAVAPDDEYQVYVTYGDWVGNNLIRVRKDGTGGAVSAVAISDPPHSANPVPQAPAHAVLVDPAHPDTLLLGNWMGIFLTTDGGVNWQSFNRGLPNVSVRELVISDEPGLFGMLRAATYGRGVWDLQIGNDQCENAIAIGDGTYTGYTTGAHGEGDATCEWDYEWWSPDVFYEYTATCGGVVTVDTCGSSYDTVLSLHSDSCPGDTGNELACNDDCTGSPCGGPASCISRPVVPGETFRIRVAGTNGSYGNYKLNVVCSIPNDACNDAQTLGVPAHVAGSTAGGFSDGAASCNGVDVTSPGVWYTVVGNGNTITASTCDVGTEFDTKLTVYCAGCGGQTCVTAGDNECGSRSQVSWCSLPGYVYHVFVHGAGAQTGAYVLDITDGASCEFGISCNPANNHCDQAQEIILGTSVGDNTNADTSAMVSCAPSSGDVWFEWEPTCNGFVTFDTCGELGSLSDTVLSLHDGCGGLEYACNDDSPNGCGLRSEVSYPAVAGHPFSIRVADYDPETGTDTGDFPLHHDFTATALAVPYPGLYIVDTNEGSDQLLRLDNEFYTSVTLGPTGTSGLTGLAWAPDIGLMYGIDTASDQMVTVDLHNGVATPFSPVGFDFVASLAWDAYERVLYGFDAVSGNLLKISSMPGEGEVIGPVGFSQVGSLALDPRRRILYGVDLATDVLLTIDLSTGAGAVVGPLGGTIDRVEGLTWDPRNRTLIGLQRDLSTGYSRIVRIDTETGLAEQVGPPYPNFDGRALEYIPGLPDATVGEYFATHVEPSGGCPTYYYADWNGLPPGLSADSYGNIQGVPVDPGDYVVSFTLDDSAVDINPIEAFMPLRVRPANDRCADAPLVADGGYPFATIGATTDGPDAGAVCSAADDWAALQGDVWFCYRAPCTGTAVASVCNSDYDTMIAVYDGCACWDGAQALACDDDGCGPGGLSGEVVVPVTAGGLYGVRVGGFANNRGHGVLGFECAGDPAGACCRESSCATETAEACAAGGGTWLGDGSTCTPDADGDALPDVCDACPQDPLKQVDPGVCGCGVPDHDTDADGNPDCVDQDDDGDGVPDDEDLSPSDRYSCRDDDGDGCDDCTPGYRDPAADGVDADADGYCVLGDCDDGYQYIYPGAPEINDGNDNQCPGDPGYGLVDELEGLLGFFNPSNRDELSWSPQPGAADYQIVRSMERQFLDCVTFYWADPVWVDPELPGPEEIYYYLVRTWTPHVGSWSRNSTGLERSVPCALP